MRAFKICTPPRGEGEGVTGGEIKVRERGGGEKQGSAAHLHAAAGGGGGVGDGVGVVVPDHVHHQVHYQVRRRQDPPMGVFRQWRGTGGKKGRVRGWCSVGWWGGDGRRH
jgi:hypothetical protein